MNDPRRTDIPEGIDKDLAAALTGFKASAEKAIAAPAPRLLPSAPVIDGKLAERGFPARHRAALNDMHGPGLDKAKELLQRILSGDCLLFLVGDRGPGKTQMATWWAAERLRAGLHVGWYRKTADLISEIKTTWRDGGKTVKTEDDVLSKYRSTAFLVLDEFHEKGSSDWEARTLINILDHRYDTMLVTVLISNLTQEAARKQINASILSRAEETGGFVHCNWPSYRSAK